MQHRARTLIRYSFADLAGVSLAALVAFPLAAQYKMTVNKERLLNAQNEPQNWLMMNGDYASTRYSKLTQINRDSVKASCAGLTPVDLTAILGAGRGASV